MENTKPNVYFDPDTKTIKELEVEDMPRFRFDEDTVRKMSKKIAKYCAFSTTSMIIGNVAVSFAKNRFDMVILKLGSYVITGTIMRKMDPCIEEFTDESIDNLIEIRNKVKELSENLGKDE